MCAAMKGLPRGGSTRPGMNKSVKIRRDRVPKLQIDMENSFNLDFR